MAPLRLEARMVDVAATGSPGRDEVLGGMGIVTHKAALQGLKGEGHETGTRTGHGHR